jgi:KDO2-lipid IV(A) lauroyltransferase
MHQALKSIIHYNKQICTHSFIADQSPSPETALWTTFLNQDTAFFTGSEKIAAKLKAPVIYAGLYRYRRGYYQVDFSLITPDASKEEQGFVTKRFAELLAIDIQHHPEQWLWSHRRWKHKRLN